MYGNSFKIILVYPNKHLADEAKRQLAHVLAPDHDQLWNKRMSGSPSTIYVMTFQELLNHPQRYVAVEDAFVIIDEGHKFIKYPDGAQVIRTAHRTFSTSATLGGVVGK